MEHAGEPYVIDIDPLTGSFSGPLYPGRRITNTLSHDPSVFGRRRVGKGRREFLPSLSKEP